MNEKELFRGKRVTAPVFYDALFSETLHKIFVEALVYHLHRCTIPWRTILVMSQTQSTVSSIWKEHDVLANFGRGDRLIVHWKICLAVSGSYWNTQDSSPVIISFEKFGSFPICSRIPELRLFFFCADEFTDGAIFIMPMFQ